MSASPFYGKQGTHELMNTMCTSWLNTTCARAPVTCGYYTNRYHTDNSVLTRAYQ